MKKQITLKNGLKAYISILQFDDAYVIYAEDSDVNTIGFCKFVINKKFARLLTPAQRELYAKNHNIDISKAPKHMEITSSSFLELHDKYKLINCTCALNQIEILSEPYFKTGLGTAMLKEMENIAAKHKCTEISAMYYPYGQFQHGTHDFYVRNGYTFDYHGIIHVTKKLEQINENTNE